MVLIFITVISLFSTACGGAEEVTGYNTEYEPTEETLEETVLSCPDGLEINFGVDRSKVMIDYTAPITYQLSIKNNRDVPVANLDILFYHDQELQYEPMSLSVLRGNKSTKLGYEKINDNMSHSISDIDQNEEVQLSFRGLLSENLSGNENIQTVVQIIETQALSCALVANVSIYLNTDLAKIKVTPTQTLTQIDDKNAIIHLIEIENVGNHELHNLFLKIELPWSEQDSNMRPSVKINISGDNLEDTSYTEYHLTDPDVPPQPIYLSLLESPVTVMEGRDILHLHCQATEKIAYLPCQLPFNIFWEDVNLGIIPDGGKIAFQFVTLINARE